ncbi:MULTISPECIES: AI-2E family transporter [Psychrobacillus]|uniref:AI-2E family transporter n=1 Tax=Psychrobacillus faecigallinarum TaxID=2762235 RepID=A0ABR8R9A0_9BACI|nr:MULTISPECIES: AI-2E family transporter [Psychrobacillus]MBD7944374.1 AI-2E family transporter [Psychrobacillus faecigallinarum]QEY22879.1 AI-2E family transporter [Psychrobacillus sp. AK 1817]QGM30250.1 AI-2E family transporter [Bacillus sp. N3536]
MEPEKPSFFSTRYIKFLGGRNTIFTLILLLMIGLIIMIYDEISFIFVPLTVFLGNVILPIILAVIVYYLLRPILRMLEKIKVKRVLGILLIFLALVGIVTLLVFLVFPFLKAQFFRLAEELPGYFIEVLSQLDSFLRTNTFISSYYLQIENDVANLLYDLPKELGAFFQNTFTGIATGISSFIGILTSFILAIVTVPFILFYLLKDGEKLPAYILKIFPPRMREDLKSVFTSIDKQISSYIQGQILVSMCIGIMIFIGFTIIGMDYALLLGVLAMVTSVVPYLGPVIAITPAAIIALVTSPFMLIKLAVVWTVVQLIEGKFISPQIMGKSLHVHPITIIFVLITSGALFGVPGVILGIPGYAILKVIVSHFYTLFKKRYNKFEPVVEKHYEYTNNKVE